MKKGNNIFFVIIIVILCVLVLALGGYILFDKSNKQPNNNELLNNNDTNSNVENDTKYDYNDYSKEEDEYIIKYAFTNNDNYESTITVEDTFAIGIRADLGKNIYILNNGNLYYNMDPCFESNNGDRHCNFTDYNPSHESDDSLKLFNKLNNIKRIKAINYGTGVDYSILAITEDGKVYRIYKNINNEISYIQIEEDFNKYGVDNILEYAGAKGSFGDIWKVVLLDGTIMEKTVTEK